MQIHSAGIDLGKTTFHLIALGAVLSVVCAATAIAQETKLPAPDTPSYLEAEHNVRHEFLQRYPLADQMPAPVTRMDGQSKAGAAAMKMMQKLMDQQPEDNKFALDFAYVMKGNVEAKKVNAKRPSYWQRQLAGLMEGLPFGGAMATSYLAQNQTRAAIANQEAPNRLALDNMQNFKILVIGYDIATGEEFDHAAPLARTRLILTMFSKVQQDISPACPFSIFLLDIDESEANEPGVTPGARGLVEHLLGKSSPEYLRFP